MKGGSIAKRYATALLSLARESQQLDSMNEELRLVAQTFSSHPKLKELMDSPVVPPSQKLAVFKELQKKISVNKTLETLIRMLIDRDRVAILPILSLIFQDMVDEELGQIRVQVTAPSDLGPAQAQLKSILESKLKQKILLETFIDPSILGGMVVQAKDRVFDASLKGELERIKDKIMQSW